MRKKSPDRDGVQAAETEHPSYGDLLRLIVIPTILSNQIRTQIEAHLPGCLECTKIKKALEIDAGSEDRKTIKPGAMNWNDLVAVCCDETIIQSLETILDPIATRCISILEQDRNNASALSILIRIAKEKRTEVQQRAKRWLIQNGITLVEDLS